ncbi:gustatory receptor for sugar taste 64f-like [Periplaneta americana]|uniref:gustatory receptor for sugar taste 64f-like n=1 Tax=Periplaneta americana TaxID=6978 RepID=UPI0037E8494D
MGLRGKETSKKERAAIIRLHNQCKALSETSAIVNRGTRRPWWRRCISTVIRSPAVQGHAVNLYAVNIIDESLAASGVLYDVPTHSYHLEAHRLLVQMTTDTVALTGLRFFPVTRTLLLTLAGTIVTYEVVLVQFRDTSGISTTNTTALCLSIADQSFSN